MSWPELGLLDKGWSHRATVWYRGMLESSGCLIAGEALGVENVEDLAQHQITPGRAWPVCSA